MTTYGDNRDMSTLVDFPYLWSWSQPEGPWKRASGWFDRDRKGEVCRVVARGGMNSCVLEFESDGWCVCTSRSGIRRRTT